MKLAQNILLTSKQKVLPRCSLHRHANEAKMHVHSSFYGILHRILILWCTFTSHHSPTDLFICSVPWCNLGNARDKTAPSLRPRRLIEAFLHVRLSLEKIIAMRSTHLHILYNFCVEVATRERVFLVRSYREAFVWKFQFYVIKIVFVVCQYINVIFISYF